MLFLLDDSVAGEATLSEDDIAGLELLLYAAWQGKHAVAALPRVLRKLTNTQLAPKPKAVVRQLFAVAPELAAAGKAKRFKVIVKPGEPSVYKSSECCWSISLGWIAENGIPSAALIAEDILDGELLLVAAKHAQSISKDAFIENIELLNGGGANTPKVLERRLVSRTSLVLCITDSDRACPSATINSTSASCSSLCNSTNWVAWHHCLNEREIENVLPENLVNDAIEGINCQDTISRLDQIRNSPSYKNYWPYLDLKEGTRLKAAFGTGEKFWAPLVQHLIEQGNLPSDCVDTKICKLGKKCNCLICPGLTPKLADHVKSHVGSMSITAAANRARTSHNAARWFELGALVADWGAAQKRTRA